MKKLVIAMFSVALVTPMFAQAPAAPAEQPKAEKKASKKKKKAAKPADEQKAEQPKAQ